MRSESQHLRRAAESVPPHAWFVVSALFHYLGPAFAVLLFPAVGLWGVAWWRIAVAAAVFATWTRPISTLRRAGRRERGLLLAMGATLALMNCSFYLALDRLPMSLVAAIEFASTISVAAFGFRTRRNFVALGLTVTGVLVLLELRWAGDLVGLGWALANSVLFATYIILGHRLSADGATNGVQRLGAAMLVAAVAVTPFGLSEAWASLSSPSLVLAGAGVAISSSVIPYIADQAAMSRLPRSSFALLLAILPATAALAGAVVLGQIPDLRDLTGIAFVVLGVAVHSPAEASS